MGITAEEALGASISYTNKKVSQSAGLHREIVQSLPVTGDEHIIYMVPKTGSGTNNYDEYMWINNAYELIGNTEVDLTDYYNKTQVDTALSGKQDTLTFDNVPTANSNNSVKSGGIFTALSSHVLIEAVSIENSKSIDAGATKLFSTPCDKSGYTPAGIVGISVNGPGVANKLSLTMFEIENSSSGYFANVAYINNTSSAITPTDIYVYILYTKS